jgi:uncharacterized protein
MRFMKGSKKVFVDTSGWIEMMLKGELHYEAVSSYFISERKHGTRMFTSDYVLDEAYTRLLTNQNSLQYAKDLYRKVGQAVRGKTISLLFTDKVVFKKAWRYFVKFSEHELSFTDATIVAFMKDLKLDEVLTLDQEFKKVGFTIKPDLDK